MAKHPDVLIGSVDAEDRVSIEVLVSGVDVRLMISRSAGEPVVVWLAPDSTFDLVGLLERALETE